MTTVLAVLVIYLTIGVSCWLVGRRMVRVRRELIEQQAAHDRVRAAFDAVRGQDGPVPDVDPPRHPPALPPLH